MSDQEQQFAWIKLFHSNGIEIRIPIACNQTETVFSVADFEDLKQSVENAVTAGFLVDRPGIEEGEHIDEIGYVVRCDVDGNNGPATRLDLYVNNDQMKFRTVSKYLNTEEDTREAEAALGLRISSMPNYVGQGYIERGKNRQTDSLVVKLPRTVKIAYKNNPRYDPNEADASKKKPKRLFSRWVGHGATQSASGQGQQPTGNQQGSGNNRAQVIDKVQFDELTSLFNRAGITDLSSFLTHMGITRLGELPASQYMRVSDQLYAKVEKAEAARMALQNQGGQDGGEIPF